MTAVGRWATGALAALVVTTVIYFAPEREVSVTSITKPETAELAAPGSSQREDRDALGHPRQEEEAEREVKLAKAKLQTARAELAEAELEVEEMREKLSTLSTRIEEDDPDRADIVAMIKADLAAEEAWVEMLRNRMKSQEAELRIAEREADSGEAGTAV